jgi:polyferredoxin
MMKKLKKHTIKRMFIQALATLAVNTHLSGYISGKIYTGNMKAVCVPVLNCYSCPGATGACPIGSLQAVVGGKKHQVSFYILGFLMLFGLLLGRFVCGFLCPFGWIQDLIYKIKIRKRKMPKKIDSILRYLKYVVLAVMVILLPMFLTNKYGIASPYFCEYICPAGTLGAGIPLTILNESLRSSIGFLFVWKISILVIILVASVLIYRPFCKYLCPLGAFYALFNKISLYQMHVNHSKCISCGACIKQCKMQVDVLKNINSTECIRCGECKAVCPTDAISSGFFLKKENENNVLE